MVRLGAGVGWRIEGSSSQGKEIGSLESEGKKAGLAIATVGVDGEKVGIALCLENAESIVAWLRGGGGKRSQRVVREQGDDGGEVVGHGGGFLS